MELEREESVRIASGEEEVDFKVLENRRADVGAQVDALASFQPTREENDRPIFGQSESAPHIDGIGRIEQLEVDPVGDHSNRRFDSQLPNRFVGQKSRAGGDCAGAAKCPALDGSAQTGVDAADAVEG